ncbi:MAG: glycosyltransferase [bacterium]|jgi:hypothetical protein|nr:glycosyltransferase [bacterium]
MHWSSLHRFWLFDDPRSYGARTILHGLAQGLREHGKTVRVFPLDPTDPNATTTMRNDLLAFHSDAVFLANHPLHLFLNQIGLNSLESECLIWIFDDPSMMGGESFDQGETVLVSDPAFIEAVRQRGGTKVHFLPVAAAALAPLPATEPIIPVSYVGATLALPQFRAQLRPPLRDYLDCVIAAKRADPSLSFEKILTTTPLSSTQRVKLSGPLAYYLYTEANRLSRLDFLQALADEAFHLYGNPAWRDEIVGSALEPCFRGPIEPLHAYPALIQQCAVNINLRSLQGFRAPTHRDFLVPALGSFLLSTPRHGAPMHPHLQESFALSRFPWSPEAVSPGDLAEKTRHYLAHPKERQDWIHSAREMIGRDHLYVHRLAQLAEQLDSPELNRM